MSRLFIKICFQEKEDSQLSQLKRFCRKYGISPRVQQNRVQEMVLQSVEEVTTVSLTIRFLNLYLLLSVYFTIHFLSISSDDFQMVFVAQI